MKVFSAKWLTNGEKGAERSLENGREVVMA